MFKTSIQITVQSKIMNFAAKWNIQKESISQKVMDKVKPDVPLRPKIDEAQKRLQLQMHMPRNYTKLER